MAGTNGWQIYGRCRTLLCWSRSVIAVDGNGMFLWVPIFVVVDIIQPALSIAWLTTPICVLIAFNLLMHYYYVCTIPPGFVEDPPREAGHGIMWARKGGFKGNNVLTGVRWSDEGGIRVTNALTTKCRKCKQVKPERAHHCRVCNRCVLKYDHHCPWINQCVGLHNERHFVMFMGYLVLSTFCFIILGYQQIFKALGVTFEHDWRISCHNWRLSWHIFSPSYYA